VARRRKTKLSKTMPVMLVIVALLLVIFVKGMELNKQNNVYAAKLSELGAELEAEVERANEIGEYKIYVTTDEFKREVLREKFNYADKNEIVFRFNN